VVTTTGEPLRLERLSYRFCGYPFEELGCFESPDARHRDIWEVAWGTARLCAHETYEDCPYYKQLQYGGDTQVQVLFYT
jgi:hypothetical protein